MLFDLTLVFLILKHILIKKVDSENFVDLINRLLFLFV